jgi:hypothetical protein
MQSTTYSMLIGAELVSICRISPILQIETNADPSSKLDMEAAKAVDIQGL